MMITIYALSDPRTQDVYYVGQTYKSLGWRLQRHLKKARGSSIAQVHQWIRLLLKQGIYPQILYLDTVPFEIGTEAEQWWMDYYNSVRPLLNQLEARDGPPRGSRKTTHYKVRKYRKKTR